MPRPHARLRPNRLPVAPPPLRHRAHSPGSAARESSLDRVRRLAREHRAGEKPFDPEKRGTWKGSSRDLVVNRMRTNSRRPRGREGLSQQPELLQQLVEMAAESSELPNYKDAESNDHVQAVAAEYDAALRQALEELVTKYPPENGASAEDLWEAQAPYLVLMTLRGEGVGIWDGDWEEFYSDTERAEDFLKQRLRRFATHAGSGKLEEAFMDAAYESCGGSHSQNGHRRGDKHGGELLEGEGEGFILIESEPNDRHPYVLVNPLDYPGNKLFGLHFEYGTHLLVWSRHLENALEPAAEWLAEHAPGLLVSQEEEQRLFEEAKSDNPELSDEEAQEEAVSDMTYTEAGYISVDWGVNFDSDAHGEQDPLFRAALEASKEEYAEVWPDSDVPDR